MAVTSFLRRVLATLAGLAGFCTLLATTSGIVFALFGEASLPTALLLGACSWLAGRAADPVARAVAPDAPRGILAAAVAVSLAFWALGSVAVAQAQGDIAAGWLGATALVLGGLTAFLQAHRRQRVDDPWDGRPLIGDNIWAIADRPTDGDWIRRVDTLDVPEDPNDPIVMRAPTGCALWRHPERLEAGSEAWSRIETLAHGGLGDSDLCPSAEVRRTTRWCAECGQIYLHEEISAPGHRLLTCIPVAYADTEAIGRLPVWDLMRFSPRLQWDETPERTYPPAWEKPHLTADGLLDRPVHQRPEGITEAEIAALPDDRRTGVRLSIAALARRGRNPRHLTLTSGGRVDYDYGKVEEDTAARASRTPAPRPEGREDGPPTRAVAHPAATARRFDPSKSLVSADDRTGDAVVYSQGATASFVNGEWKHGIRFDPGIIADFYAVEEPLEVARYVDAAHAALLRSLGNHPAPLAQGADPSVETPPGAPGPSAPPPAGGEKNDYLVRLPEPTHCALWRRPGLVKDGRATWSEVVELCRDDSPWGDVYRDLVTCRECGQLYFSEDNYRDDDRVFRTYIPVENAERAHALNELNIWRTAEYFPRIHWDDEKEPKWRRAGG